MDRRDLNKNKNYRCNNRRNEVNEQPNELKESFMKAKEPKISHIVLEDVLDKTMKSLIICDSSY